MPDVVPLVDEGLGNSAYLVDLGDGGALVVDPERDPRPYRRELDRRGLTSRFVVETHLHADFVSGGRELAATGARLLAPAGSDLTFPHEPLADGDEVDLGGLRLQVIATPGHTPEHLAHLLLDGARPAALFSGGTLMAGGVARPDLLTPERTEPLARAAYRSITRRLLTLPDDLPVLPTHGGGSFCAAGASGERTTTIGRERDTNPLLTGDPDEDTFVARLLGGLGSYPPYFLELRDVNRAGPVVHGSAPVELPTLSVHEVDAAVADGAEVVDVRSIDAFAAGHLPGSLSNPWRPQFATWLGWLVRRDRPIVVVADGAVDRQDLVWAARTIGYERIVGELAGGIDAWRAAGRPLTMTPLVGPRGAAGRRVVDVRQDAEFDSGHVAGAAHIELGALSDLSVARDLVPSEPVLLHCGHGERAMTAASLLERAGHRDVTVLAGGPEDIGDLRADG
ncbi:rhodanese-like domain-containing protein [Nitriliruptor alkaliphilus]|uniref:rhodanese-like domain-containing protein n=1 Tax=Nitriliruptor alkaliphilus TaxID=427918 RepID=UPI0006985113|nr:MBL fold metallo-hydrolase [Nitriliruptor alkaliphilus]